MGSENMVLHFTEQTELGGNSNTSEKQFSKQQSTFDRADSKINRRTKVIDDKINSVFGEKNDNQVDGVENNKMKKMDDEDSEYEGRKLNPKFRLVDRKMVDNSDQLYMF